jgi:glycosyltransferase involved in cell wall biosynthesis
MSDLTIIIPAYNEEEGILYTIEKILPYLDKYPNWNITVVNDGSIDNTRKILEKCNRISLINHPFNKGYGAALKTGILFSKTEFIAMYDADGQHNPEDLENMWKNRENFDMIIGLRGKDSHSDWMRKPGKWLLQKTANFLTGVKIPDLNSGLRIIRRMVICDKLHLFSNGFSFSTTSTVALMNLGFFIKYEPIKVNKRIGISTVKQLKHGADTILLILRLIVLFKPLKVFLPASVILMTIGLIYEIIWGIIAIPGVKLLPGALLLFISGLVIFFFGLLTDQVSELRKHATGLIQK